MNFRIADTFTDSLAKLTGEEQEAVKTGAVHLQLNPSSPGIRERVQEFTTCGGAQPWLDTHAASHAR